MISVLVVSFNARDHLRHCLDKLHEQRGTWGEVIVIDNASSDGSAEMVEKDFSWCRLKLLDKNLGFGAANNIGARKAKGDLLLLLNSDAWLADDEALPKMEARLCGNDELAFVVPQLRYPDGRWQFTWCPETGVVGEALQMARNRFEASPFAHRHLPKLLRALTGPGWYTAACLLVKKQAFDAVDGFDEKIFLYFEDVDLSRRLRLAGWKMELVEGAVAAHVKGGSAGGGSAGGGSAHANVGEVEYRRAQLRYYRKHRPAWESRYLRRRLHKKFSKLAPSELRLTLLRLLDKT